MPIEQRIVLAYYNHFQMEPMASEAFLQHVVLFPSENAVRTIIYSYLHLHFF